MEANKTFMPVLLDISEHKILLIGGGESAYKKLKLLQRFTCNVDILALKVSDKIKTNGAKWKEKAYTKNALKGYRIVYSCSNNQETDRQIVVDAHDLGLLVNIHDKPLQCDFISPAIYKNEDLTVSVGSNGKNVYQSIKIRDIIKEFLETKKISGPENPSIGCSIKWN